MPDSVIPIGSITPGVGRCWLVDINHEDGPVGEAWSEAYTSLRRAKADIVDSYGADVVRFSAIAGSAGWLVQAVTDA
jgi:hypothetical protein